MKKSLLMLTAFLSLWTMAQQNDHLPYYEIPDCPERYTAGAVASRMIDGLGFRYYWATEGLRAQDLNYKPSDTGRSSSETIDHILGLSDFILKSISKEDDQNEKDELSFEEKRRRTLLNLKKASDILRPLDDLAPFDNERFPFWNLVNGPIADAIWHCGQVVMLRRASGNPFNSKVSVFAGKLRE
ncbi:hypothetical protein [Aestuariivivens sediminis]|uniref:hypothetical protein n=1 Tax=Aestuariivivens sediminis TaxID=2913557 RepID=UPI001F58F7BE|nr:hypothetical protein [Aestuariivivens sediminis]